MSNFGPQGQHANGLTIGPLSAFTPESMEIMELAAALIAEGKDLRKKAKNTIEESMENARLAGKTVDDYFVKKISETVTLSVRMKNKNTLKTEI